jgi:hypothetical protein
MQAWTSSGQTEIDTEVEGDSSRLLEVTLDSLRVLLGQRLVRNKLAHWGSDSNGEKNNDLFGLSFA